MTRLIVLSDVHGNSVALAAVRKAIQVELRKDLVKLPVHEIEKELLFAARGQRTHGRNASSLI